eukprot:tig00021070_g17830.t1
MTLETLQALAPLARTLKRLSCGVIIDGPLLPVCSSIAGFLQLEQLELEFYNSTGVVSRSWPKASEADLQPLSSLSSLRAYAVQLWHKHTSFLSGMRQLEYICLNMSMRGPADVSSLLSFAGSLRAAVLNYYDRSEAGLTSFAAAVSNLPTLTNLFLGVQPGTLVAFSELSLKQWTRLKTLTLHCKASCVRCAILQTLTVQSPLPLGSASGLVAVSSLKHLRRLVITDKAAAALDDDSRRELKATLLRTRIFYG